MPCSCLKGPITHPTLEYVHSLEGPARCPEALAHQEAGPWISKALNAKRSI